jgi:hypothetical protein
MSESICPGCGSSLIVEIANAKHCNTCGNDFGLDRHPIVTARAKAKSDASAKSGYQKLGLVEWMKR